MDVVLCAFAYIVGIINGMMLFKYIQWRIMQKHKQKRPVIHECTCRII